MGSHKADNVARAMSRYIATLVYLFSPHPLRCLSTTIHNRLITCMPSILELFCNTNPPHLEHCASRAQTRTGFVTTSSLAIGIDKQASLKSLSGSGTTYTNIFKMLHFHRTLSTVPLKVSPILGASWEKRALRDSSENTRTPCYVVPL